MNPIVLTFLIIYLTVVLTKNVISNKELAASLPPAIGSVMIFIRDNMNDIFLTMAVMLGMITYFVVAGVSFDAKPKVTLEKEVTIEKFDNIESLNQRAKERKNMGIEEAEEFCSPFKNKKDCTTHGQCGWFQPSDGTAKCVGAMPMTEKGISPTLTLPTTEVKGDAKVFVGPMFQTCHGSGVKGCESSHTGVGTRWGPLDPAN